MSKLGYVTKLWISSAAFIACIFALSYFYQSSIQSNIDFAKKELEGNAYQRAAMPLLSDVNKLQAAYINKGNVEEIANEIDKKFAAIDEVQNSYGESLQFTEEGLKSRDRSQFAPDSVKTQWAELKKSISGSYDSKVNEAIRGLEASFRGIIAHAGDTSNLILDPDLDSYYLMDVTLVALPQTIDRLGQVQAKLLTTEMLDEAAKIEFAVQARMLKESDHDRVVADFDVAYKEDKNFNGESATFVANTKAPLEEFKAKYAAAVESLEYLEKDGSKEAINKAASAVSSANESADKLWNASVAELDVMLQTRIENYQSTITKTLAQCGLALVAAMLFFAFVLRDITKPLNNIQSKMSELTAGKTDIEISHTKRQDGIGDMARALVDFRSALSHNQLMQKMTSDYPVIRCDRDMKVVFVNDAADKVLQNLKFSREALLNKNISIFHSALATQRNSQAIETIQLGDDWVEAVINPLQDKNGASDGIYLNIRNVSDIKRTQAGFNSLIDKVTIHGVLSERINSSQFTGFYKELADSMNGLLDAIIKPVNTAIATLGDLAKGDLTRTMEGRYNGTFADMQVAMNDTIVHLKDIVLNVSQTAMSVKTASTEIEAGSTDLASRTESQAGRVQETTASVQQLTQSVKDNASSTNQAKHLATKASDVATEGGIAMNKVVGSIQDIAASSNKISDIISVIDEIAFQTNLLALNAAVEAARAGDAGKGFAVVASEVRALAGRSAEASKEIKSLISESVEKVKEGTNLVGEAGKVLENIVESVNSLNSVVTDIANTCSNQSLEIAQINEALLEIDSSTQQNAAMVEESNAASRTLLDQSESLEQLMHFFKTENNGNVYEMRRAG
jgi:methyl-accepting chemotaxis protein